MKLRCLVLLLTAMLVAPQCISARTWYITPDGSGDAPTIQAGVDNAAVGDTVLVGIGTHSDTSHVMIDGELRVVGVVLDKNITLLGETTADEVVVDASVSEIAIYVTGVDATARIERVGFLGDLSGIACLVPSSEKSSGTYPFDVAIQCVAATPVMRENRFRAMENGMFLRDSPVTVQNNVFSGILIAIEVYTSPDVVIRDNEFVDCGTGVLANGRIHILSNFFTFTGQPPFMGCSGIVFTGEAEVVENRFEDLLNDAIVGNGTNALIERNEIIDVFQGVWLEGSGSVVRQNIIAGSTECMWFDNNIDLLVEENTFDGGQAITFVRTVGTIRNNIIVNALSGVGCVLGSSATMECNNVYATTTPYSGECPDVTGVSGNIAVDPEFCGIPGSRLYTLQSDSPCAPGNHPSGYACGRIGALDVGCNEVPVHTRSWGALKALYEKGGNDEKQ